MNERNKIMAELGQQLPHLADDTVWCVGYLLRDFVSNMVADNGSVDTGCGFGEFCLDFKADGKDCRVVVSLPNLKEPT